MRLIHAVFDLFTFKYVHYQTTSASSPVEYGIGAFLVPNQPVTDKEVSITTIGKTLISKAYFFL